MENEAEEETEAFAIISGETLDFVRVEASHGL
jgi:hypothetical protein